MEIDKGLLTSSLGGYSLKGSSCRGLCDAARPSAHYICLTELPIGTLLRHTSIGCVLKQRPNREGGYELQHDL